MKYRHFAKKIAHKMPIVGRVISQRDNLFKIKQEQQRKIHHLSDQNKELQKTIYEYIRKNRDPKLTQDYEYATNPIFQITKKDIDKSKIATSKKLGLIKTANWLVPSFQHISFGGLFTIFRFIHKLGQEGVKNNIIIYNDENFDIEQLALQIKNNFPSLTNYQIIAFDYKGQKLNKIPECDIAFCTLWESAYILLRLNNTKRKYYFIQDYEPMFFPAGTISALSESTYRFGFKGIVNTTGLLDEVRSRHGMEATAFTPAVDKNIYYLDSAGKKPNNPKIKVFYYARPTKPRNAFNLGVQVIKQLLEVYGNKIEIITAGAEWDESEYGLAGKVTNLGLLKTITEVADLYRTCDIGFCFMLTRHPSYQPIEFMASGVATVVNMNESNLWLLKNRKNCLISEPSPKAMAHVVGELIDNDSLRKEIVMNGEQTIRNYSWDKQTSQIWDKIQKW